MIGVIDVSKLRTQTTESRKPSKPAAESFRPNGLAGDVPRDGTRLEQPAPRRLALLALALLACACAGQTEPTQTTAGATCGLDLDARFAISVDGAQVFEGRAADFQALPCAAPVRTCSPWRATALCTDADGFTRQTWTLDGNDGAVTLETETRTLSTTTELTMVAR
jgi:hypothetical protein